MTEVILIRARNNPNAGVPENSDAGKFGGRRYPPYGVLSIKGYLRAHGIEAVILDRFSKEYFDMTPSEFARVVIARSPKFVGMSSFTTQAADAEGIAKAIREIDPEVSIVHGGVHFSSLPEMALETADYVVVGDGEEAMRRIVAGEVESGPCVVSGTPLSDLDEIPVVQPDDLAETGFDATLIEEYGVISGRGCPFNCYFCKDGVRGSKVRHHSVGQVLDQIDVYFALYGSKPVFVLDDVFLPGRERLLAYIAEIERRRMKVKFQCFMHPNAVLRSLLEDYRRLGIETVALGIESGSDRILDEMGKGCDRVRIVQAVRDLQTHGFRTIGLFILGHRGETKESMDETLSFAEELPLDFCHFSYLAPFPGTPMWIEGIDKYGRIVEEDMSMWGNAEPVFLPHGLTIDQLEGGMARGRRIMKKKLRRMRSRRVIDAVMRGDGAFLVRKGLDRLSAFSRRLRG